MARENHVRVALLVSIASLVSLPLLMGGCGSQEKTEDKPVATAVAPLKPQPPGSVTVTGSQLSRFSGITEKIKSQQIPEQAIICTVGDDAINVSDYKNNFRYKQGQAKQLLQVNIQVQRDLEKTAEKLGITLTPDEKKSLLSKAKEQGGSKLAGLFKSGKVKEADFDKQVLRMGIALKVTNKEIEENLLNEMINNSLLLDAARKNGLGKIAFNRYVEFKHSAQYKKALELSTLTQNQLKDMVVEDILINLMKEKIIKKAEISDKHVYDFYLLIRDKRFRHPGRFRWSQVFIAAPIKDFGIFPSLANAIKREFPKKSAQEQAEMLDKIENAKKQKALKVLSRAKSGEDFAKLANEMTEDPPARASKTGGDMGFATIAKINASQAFRPVAYVLEKMEKGQVYPKLVRTDAGWHIIKLTEKTAAGYLPFEEVKGELKPYMARKQAGLAVFEWIGRMRQTVPITFTPQFADIVPRGGMLHQKENQPVSPQ